MRRLTALLALVLFGCSINPGTNPDAVDIDGKVTLAGKDVNGVILNLQVTGTGSPATLPVAKGAVKGKITPGKYTYFLSQGTSAAEFKAVPAKYREGSLEREVDIKGPGPVDFKFD